MAPFRAITVLNDTYYSVTDTPQPWLYTGFANGAHPSAASTRPRPDPNSLQVGSRGYDPQRRRTQAQKHKAQLQNGEFSTCIHREDKQDMSVCRSYDGPLAWPWPSSAFTTQTPQHQKCCVPTPTKDQQDTDAGQEHDKDKATSAPHTRSRRHNNYARKSVQHVPRQKPSPPDQGEHDL